MQCCGDSKSTALLTLAPAGVHGERPTTERRVLEQQEICVRQRVLMPELLWVSLGTVTIFYSILDL